MWTIQTIDAWNHLQQTGKLRAHEKIITQEFLHPYKWMCVQMEKRIGNRPDQATYPLWAWYQWRGEQRKRPDLRYSAHLPSGMKGVRLQIELQPEQVLLSDFDLWHYVLNYWYLARSKEEEEKFEAEIEREGLCFYKMKPLPHPKFHRRIVTSWEHIFDLDWIDQEQFITYKKKDKSIQATFWELRLDEISEVKPFTAR